MANENSKPDDIEPIGGSTIEDAPDTADDFDDDDDEEDDELEGGADDESA